MSISKNTAPYRLVRNCFSVGLMIYVRNDIPSKELNKHRFSNNVEALFIELNFRKFKLLLVGVYHSIHQIYGCNDKEFFNQVGIALDSYSNYNKFLLAGDFNIQEEEPMMQEFLYDFSAKNLVKEHTCFKNPLNPSCIDLFITNCAANFQNTSVTSTCLSDFHKMTITVLKGSFPKSKAKIITYRDYSKFNINQFYSDISERLDSKQIDDYNSFNHTFVNILNGHAPYKKK